MDNIIGENLKYIRRYVVKATMMDFAKFLDISINKLQNYETGRTVPEEHLLREFELKCSLPPESLENRLLTKKEIPVIVSKQSDADLERMKKEMALLRKELSSIKKLMVSNPKKKIPVKH
jgi:hypothetical protein